MTDWGKRGCTELFANLQNKDCHEKRWWKHSWDAAKEDAQVTQNPM